MIRPHNRDQSKQNLKLNQKRKDEPVRDVSKKHATRNTATIVVKQPTLTNEQMMDLERMKSYQGYEIINTQKKYSQQDLKARSLMAKFLLYDIKKTQNFTLRTVEHAIKMIDIYFCKKSKAKKDESIVWNRRHLYPQRNRLMLDVITCYHISAKYNQIYPSQLREVIEAFNYKFQTGFILDNQFTILNALDLNLNVALVSDWFKMLTKELMPVWAYLCFCDYNLDAKSKTIAEDIILFISTAKSSIYSKNFMKLHQLSLLGCLTSAIQLFDAFANFRSKKQIKNMISRQQTMITQKEYNPCRFK